MVSRIVEVPIGNVLDNPNRDFTNYPIDRAQVERLKASFEETGGIWHGLPARRYEKTPYGGWTYQLCFGHHRLVAAKELKYETVRLEVADHDDDEMNLMLAVENGTQRVNNAAASLDSVAAITRRLAYFLLRAESLEHLSTIVERSWADRLFGSQKAFETAKGNLLNGKGIGEPLILKYAPPGTLDAREVRSSIDTLKNDGGYQKIIETVTARVQVELAEEEAGRARDAEVEREKAERERIKAEQQAEKERVKAEKDAERERKKAEKAQADAEKAEQRRKDAEAKAERDAELKAQREKDAAEKAQADAEAELARMEVERERREREADEREQKRRDAETKRAEQKAEADKREAELLALAVKAAEAEPLLDSAVVPYFRNHHALSRFREIVTDGSNRHWFPVDGQLGHVKEICRLFEEQNRKPAADNLTANFVASYLNGYLRECLRGKREDEKRQRTLNESFDVQLEKAMKGANWIAAAVVDMIHLIEDGAGVPDDFEAKLRSLEERTTFQLAELRKVSGYVKGGKEIAGRAVASPNRLAISNR